MAASRPGNMLVHLSGESAQTVIRAATLRQKWQIQSSYLTQSQYANTGPTSLSADPLTPGRVATRTPMFQSLA